MSAEIRIDVPNPMRRECVQSRHQAARCRGANAEQRLVGQDVLPVEETQLPPTQKLPPGTPIRQGKPDACRSGPPKQSFTPWRIAR
jgi:hypothetical protein